MQSCRWVESEWRKGWCGGELWGVLIVEKREPCDWYKGEGEVEKRGRGVDIADVAVGRRDADGQTRVEAL